MPQICIYLLGLWEKKWDKNYSQIMSPLSPLRLKVGGHVPPMSYGGAAHAGGPWSHGLKKLIARQHYSTALLPVFYTLLVLFVIERYLVIFDFFVIQI